jgi:hypothetical protein
LDLLVGHSPACATGVSVSLGGTTLSVNFDVSTSVAADLEAWHVSASGIKKVLSKSFSPTPAPVPVTDSLTVKPNFGTQGIEAAMKSTTGEYLCEQGAFVN